VPNHVLYDTVHSFGLAVRLGVEGGAYCLGDTHQATQFGKEVASEAGIAIMNQLRAESMMFDHCTHIQVSKFSCRNSSATGDNMRHLGQLVHEHRDGIKPSSSGRQSRDQIHGDAFPKARRDLKGLQQPSRFLCASLIALAILAGSNELLYILVQSRPNK
jgi:hypothetical protein